MYKYLRVSRAGISKIVTPPNRITKVVQEEFPDEEEEAEQANEREACIWYVR